MIRRSAACMLVFFVSIAALFENDNDVEIVT